MLGQDALDLAVDRRQDVADAVITLSDQLSALNGRVETTGGAPDYTMILFSTERTHWRPQSRRIMTTRIAADEYHLAPVDDVEPGEWFDPSFLDRLVPGALRVTIGEGEKKVQNIRVGGG